VPPTLRGGRFVILGTLGEGSQGCTFDGVDKRVGQAVAIKRFDVRGATSWKDVDLAEREARVLQSLAHPRLPRYIDRFEEEGALYLVMEKIEGVSLGALRKRGATLGAADVVRLLHDAAEVLDYLHSRSPPVIHRDLKPGNVLRRPDGSFAFVDFGAVRDKLRPEGGSTVVGTFGYMAPEQFQGRALPGSDVYAVGATALAMLTGREPETLPHRGLAIDVRSALRGQASDRLVGVLERMLDPDPDRRAARIGPLLARLAGAGAAGTPPSRRSVHDERRADYDDRLQRRQARRAARRADRAARWQARTMQRRPFPFSLLVTVLFLVAILGVTIATRLVVPLVLAVLSLFLARRALLAGAETVRRAGHRAVDAMVGTRGGGDERRKESPRVRVDPEKDPDRARVAFGDEEEEEEEEDDRERPAKR
jgi:hypothetical protein